MRCLGLLTVVLLALGACGGEEPAPELELRTAPLWMAELDLPGCDAVPGKAGVQVEALVHPYDRGLVLLTEGGVPCCVTESGQPFQSSGGSYLAPPSGDDDPIPLAHGGDSGGGEADDDPIPLARADKQHPAGDDPIPLVRERNLQADLGQPTGTGSHGTK
jgi:hypothetical protein